jgi:hypothetical protein
MEEGVPIDELLSFKYVSSSEGLQQYAPCFRLNIGTGENRNFAPLSRLRRIHTGALLQMNINKHDHQRMIMSAIRSYIEDVDKKNKEEEEKEEEKEESNKMNQEGDDDMSSQQRRNTTDGLGINTTMQFSIATSGSHSFSPSSSRPTTTTGSAHGSRREAEKSTSKGMYLYMYTC